MSRRNTREMESVMRRQDDALSHIPTGSLDLGSATYQRRGIIDTDVQPYIPEGWTVSEHRATGLLQFLSGKIELYYSRSQLLGNAVLGKKLREELKAKKTLNASVLDYLLAHPECIPESWKFDDEGSFQYIFFWGTEYSFPGGGVFIRCLYWNTETARWCSDYRGLESQWGSSSPHVIDAS